MTRAEWIKGLLRLLGKERRVFISGTDTGVGKTWVACALARAWAAQGHRVGVFKPAESGNGGDAKALIMASGLDWPLAWVRPYAFAHPLAPAVAAAQEGKRVSRAVLQRSYERVQAGSDRILVEGAGGLLVPYGPGLDGAGLAKALGLPLLIIARAKLGTINHSLLTIEAARRRGLTVLGVVLNGPHDRKDPSVASNAAQIRRLGKVPVLQAPPWK